MTGRKWKTVEPDMQPTNAVPGGAGVTCVHAAFLLSEE